MTFSPRPAAPSIPRLVIVDADRRVQQSLADLLGVSGEVDVVGRAGDVRAALKEVERRHPDVVLVDPRLPDLEAGLALIRGLGTAWPGLRIVTTGWNDTDGHSVGDPTTLYVSRTGSPEEFVSAIVACCAR
ncbi:MAG: response regulator transcription factor [Chloroflexi bacterium]|nr:response regulator transcription factor [Chloroflexota bacterium]